MRRQVLNLPYLFKKMNKKVLLECVSDFRYISGSYNYCDRWCEKCQFTSRCLECFLEEKNSPDENLVVSILETTAYDGKNYKTKFYNFNAIIVVDYGMNSYRVTR